MTPETRPYTHSAGLGRASRILAYRTRLAALAALAIGLIFVQIGLFQHAAIVPWQQRAADAVLVALLLIAVYRLNQHMSARGARPVATAPEEALLWVLFGSAAVAILTRTGGLRAVADALSIAALSIFTEVVVAYEALKIALALPRAVLVARVARLTVSPSATVALSFAVVIAAGTILLNLPAATAGGRLTRPVDALFTATSATCVTGLIVHDTPTHWSFFGQLVILALIQIGGLGTMTLGTTMRTLLRQRLSVIERVAMRDTVAPVARADIAHLAARIVQFTAVCELAGALVLALWWWSGGMPFLLAMWKGLFHAVSAFCNAGFSLFSNSLEDFAGDPVVNVVICSLIVVGGLGFPAVTDIWRYAKARLARRRAHLSLHTRLVLLTTAALIIGAATFFAAVEWNGAFARRPAHERLLAAVFASVTPRTAGFDTVPPADFSLASQFLTVALMFVGASPSSTGGGIKTTTAALMVLLLLAIARGDANVEIGRRRVSEETRHRAFAVVGLMGIVLFAVTLALCMTEKGVSLAEAVFETASAQGTVGLSLGLTPRLSTAGRLILALTMYIGRVGPLTMALALLAPRRRRVSYPQEDVLVG